MLLLTTLIGCSFGEFSWVPNQGQWLIIEARTNNVYVINNSQYCGDIQTTINGQPVEPICSPSSTGIYAVPVPSGVVDVTIKPDYHDLAYETVVINDAHLTKVVINCQFERIY